jgi:hypothetical protein
MINVETYSQELIDRYIADKIKVRVTFKSGRIKWGWIHRYDNRYWLTRGNKVGFSLDTAIKIEEMSK